MTPDRLDRIETGIAANTQAIADLNQTINLLVTEFVRPTAQQAFSNFERLERLESALETLVAQSLVNAEQIEANQQQIASSAENITKLGIKVDEISETVRGQSQQIQVLIEEGRADRQAQREALSAILNNDSRISSLEQRAG